MNLTHILKVAARSNPHLLSWAWALRRPLQACRLMNPSPSQRSVVGRGFDIVIDGYPRSANTFASDAFLFAQGYSGEVIEGGSPSIKIGNHMHTPAQFILAKSYKVPALLVLRNPIDAALSWLVYAHGRDAASTRLRAFQGRRAAETALRDYIDFHRRLVHLTDSFVIAPFEEVTADFGRSIARVNERFGTSFALFDHTTQNEELVFELMRARVEERGRRFGADLTRTFHFPQERKQEMRKHFIAQFQDDGVAPIAARALTVYHRLLDAA